MTTIINLLAPLLLELKDFFALVLPVAVVGLIVAVLWQGRGKPTTSPDDHPETMANRW